MGTTFAWHGFPIIWFEAQLNQMQLVPGIPTGFVRKIAEIVQRRAHPPERFSGHVGVYKLLYNRSMRDAVEICAPVA